MEPGFARLGQAGRLPPRGNSITFPAAVASKIEARNTVAQTLGFGQDLHLMRIQTTRIGFAGILLLLLFSSLVLHADNQAEGPLNTAKPTGIAVDEIIRRFAAKEKEFKLARDHYTFRQTIKVQAMDGDTVK